MPDVVGLKTNKTIFSIAKINVTPHVLPAAPRIYFQI